MRPDDLIGKYALDPEETEIFRSYIENRFENAAENDTFDTDFLLTWEKIVMYAEIFGAAKAVNDKVTSKRPVDFHSPEGVSIVLTETDCGKIPIISVSDASDFEQLVTNIAYNGIRPDNISTTGASFISGKKTRFIILSSKPYSNVPASELGLPDDKEWQEKSMQLRRGHECTHYFTKQIYGITNNILHDEIMADFIGMYEAFRFYKAEWFLRFMGIIEGSGARFVFYTKDLPKRVRNAVSELASQTAYSLEKWSQTDIFKAMTTSERIKCMCKAGFEGMLNFS